MDIIRAYTYAKININEARDHGIVPELLKKFMPNTMDFFKEECEKNWEKM